MKSHTSRHNINRGYMKLEVQQEATVLFRNVYQLVNGINKLDLKLRSQILDAAQSISSNISEGYCRRTINEYLQFLNVALGSAGELMTRMIGLSEIDLLQQRSFDQFDVCHFSMENKLIALIRSLQIKRREGTWVEECETGRD